MLRETSRSTCASEPRRRTLAKANGLPTLYDAAGDAAGPLAGVKAGLIWAEEPGRARAGREPLRRPSPARRRVRAS